MQMPRLSIVLFFFLTMLEDKEYHYWTHTKPGPNLGTPPPHPLTPQPLADECQDDISSATACIICPVTHTIPEFGPNKNISWSRFLPIKEQVLFSPEEEKRSINKSPTHLSEDRFQVGLHLLWHWGSRRRRSQGVWKHDQLPILSKPAFSLKEAKLQRRSKTHYSTTLGGV